MKEIFDQLFELLGSHSAVADTLQYSDRQYRNIRRRVERGQALQPRVEQWIMANFRLLKRG